MATLKAKNVRTNLCKKGFLENPKGHHRQYSFVQNGIITEIRTRMSHNDQDIDDYLQGQMAKQIKLCRKDFIKFVSCEVGEDEYVKLLKANGYL